jgi:hypothetical protein
VVIIIDLIIRLPPAPPMLLKVVLLVLPSRRLYLSAQL